MKAVDSPVPTIRLWNCLLVPIQGDVSDSAADILQHTVLEAIRRDGARGLILDISGMWLLDSHLCAVVARLARSAMLMGTPTVLCGLRAEMALTLQSMGVAFTDIKTTLSLEEALAHFGVVPQHTPSNAQPDPLALLLGESA
ncbi:MAG: STAS domain-containing protein [Myxococcota bacterium]